MLYITYTHWLIGIRVCVEGQSRNMRRSRDQQSQEVTSSTHTLESRKSDAVEMDEMMAAMVLTSLSCSPVVQSPPGAEANFSGKEGAHVGSGCSRGPRLTSSGLSS